MSNQKTIGVDIGNTSIKTAEFSDHEVGDLKKWRSIDEIIEAYPDTKFVISGVGIANDQIMIKFKDHFIVDAKVSLPIDLDYSSPETLGSDRIAAAVGAWSLFPKRDILIVDVGTCITYDLVTKDGVFRGGMISPGLDMRLKAMHEFTKNLPLIKADKKSSKKGLVGKTTKECIWLGAKNGMKSEIDGILESFNKKHDRLQVVVTGGWALDFESTAKAHIFADSKIVLDGLHAIWKLNEAN